MNTTTNVDTSTRSRALTLLGQGISPEVVSASLGVSPSRISQLISEPEFAAQIAELRFQNLSKHNARDNSYDQLEDDLIERMKNCLPMMYKPMEILKAIQVINSAKRRGQSAPDSIIQQQTIINLTLPTQIINNFSLNNQKHVTKVGDKDLVTMQAGTLLSRMKGTTNDSPRLIDSAPVSPAT